MPRPRKKVEEGKGPAIESVVTGDSGGTSPAPEVASSEALSPSLEPAAIPPADAPVVASPAVEPVTSDDDDDGDGGEAVGTVTVPLTAKGSIAWKALKKEATKDKIRKAMGTATESHSKHKELEGLTKIAPALWLGIQMVSGWAMTRKAPGPLRDKLQETLAYSKDELEALTGPTADLLQKYVPASIADYSTEMNFVMVVGQVHMAKIVEVQQLIEAYAEAEARKVEIARPASIADTVHLPQPPFVPEVGLGE